MCTNLLSTITNLLSTWYGIHGIALDWFVSYLSDRKKKVNPNISLDILTKCLEKDVSSWMSSMKLKLNPDQTEFLLIGSKVQREKNSKRFPTRLLAQEVTPSPSARNLGIVFSYIWYISRLLLS